MEGGIQCAVNADPIILKVDTITAWTRRAKAENCEMLLGLACREQGSGEPH